MVLSYEFLSPLSIRRLNRLFFTFSSIYPFPLETIDGELHSFCHFMKKGKETDVLFPFLFGYYSHNIPCFHVHFEQKSQLGGWLFNENAK